MTPNGEILTIGEISPRAAGDNFVQSDLHYVFYKPNGVSHHQYAFHGNGTGPNRPKVVAANGTSIFVGGYSAQPDGQQALSVIKYPY